jgi:uncharacterized Fe-S cluster-containing protein
VTETDLSQVELPGLDCGLCGFRTCADMASRLPDKHELLKRCIPLGADFMTVQAAPTNSQPAGEKGRRASSAPPVPIENGEACAVCDSAAGCATPGKRGWGNDAPLLAVPILDPATDGVVVAAPGGAAAAATGRPDEWRDHLGREFDFVLEHFPEEAGPREQIIPHNPVITRELEIEPGEILIGRPLGISCGCPITHCGIVQSVDMFTGAIVWCVTGPLHPRQHGFKDIGYYSAQAYEGLINKARTEVEIGRRYWFQPRMCMMQWRHSGLVNFLNRGSDGLQVRIEGLWIG